MMKGFLLTDVRKYKRLNDNETLSKVGISKGCNDQVCPNIERFYEFFNSVQDKLNSNKTITYQEFIMKQLTKGEIHENSEPNGQGSCTKASLVTCEELVADFAFLSMSKVMF